MAQSSEDHAEAGPAPAAEVGETRRLNVRRANARQLLVELILLKDTISAVDPHDPSLPDVVRREQRISDELRRREALLMQGIRWTRHPTSPATRSTGRALVDLVTRPHGPHGSGGPGRWDE